MAFSDFSKTYSLVFYPTKYTLIKMVLYILLKNNIEVLKSLCDIVRPQMQIPQFKNKNIEKTTLIKQIFLQQKFWVSSTIILSQVQ